MPTGFHTVTLTATNSSGLAGIATVSVGVGFPTNSIGMTFNAIPAGTFTMGSPLTELGRNSDETEHEVTLTQPFYMQTTEVTQAQWYEVMGNNPSFEEFVGWNCPVGMVSWIDIQGFIAALNFRESGVTDSPYRLPTEAEWEYSCRAGTTTAFYTGEITQTDYYTIDPNLDEAGWYGYRAFTTGEIWGPVTVAQKTPNAWGLYDMYGNATEWCSDWKGYYPTGSVTDPTGPSSGGYRVHRGGSWCYDARGCRSAVRHTNSPAYTGSDNGFRLLRTD
jgi:formylglycine-generating enzyme required for sulfatase activity